VVTNSVEKSFVIKSKVLLPLLRYFTISLIIYPPIPVLPVLPANEFLRINFSNVKFSGNGNPLFAISILIND
jgi:hypothetical protein